jgi:hypothetical protein
MMDTGSSAHQGYRWVAIALAALLALTLAFAAESAGAAGTGQAVAAKKCKGAKKKKCKKKRLALPGPLVRGTVTWTSNVDVDLHAYDASGNHSGVVGPPTNAQVQGIPSSVLSPDLGSAGSETFTDLIYQVGGIANREFSYIVCFYGTTSGTFTGVGRLGITSVLPLSGTLGSSDVLTVPGGPVPPNPSAVC